mmetsp:Transcript_104584/g.337248  ORF Transcript_104584/g.337248 Transcript_104584/m.337248 type:complete len:197 (-) Transcript_104584:52-642(-)
MALRGGGAAADLPQVRLHSWRAARPGSEWTTCKTVFASESSRAAHKKAASAEGPSGQAAEPNKHGLICGVSVGDGHSNGHISCGIPMYRDKTTSAPYILPLYTQPAPAAKSGATSGAAAAMEVAASARLRQDALQLLKRFLDAAPASDTGSVGPDLPEGVMAYPIPSKRVPGSVEVVPDLGPIGTAPPVLGPGSFL